MDDDTFVGKIVKFIAISYGGFALITLMALYFIMIGWSVYALIYKLVGG